METILHPKYSKEDIIQRMVFSIAKKWQIDEKDVQAKFDPLMMLLVEVIAHELDTINARWDLSVDEITETIIHKYFPEYPIAEELPHVVMMQASAAEATAIIPDTFNFYLPQAQQDLSFTPVEPLHLLGLQLHSTWFNHKPFDKQAGFQAKEQEVVRSIGILCEVNRDLSSLDKLQLYIVPGNVAERELLLYAIKHANCYANGTEINVSNKNSSATSDGSYWDKLKSLSVATYSNAIITVNDTGLFEALKEESEIWQNIEERQKKQMDISRLVYLHWELPVSLQYRWLKQLSIYPNAFIAVNRAHRTIQYKVEPLLNVIPLAIDRQLMYVDKVASDAGQRYSMLDAVAEDALEDGSCTLKTGQFGSMNSDGLRYHIQSLKEEVSNSAAFFSNISNDTITAHLKDMQRTLFRVQDKMQQATPLKQQLRYLLVKPYRTDKFITVDYWTFDNEHLKLLRPDTVLDCKGALIQKGTAQLLSKPYPLSANYTNTQNKPLVHISSRRDVEQLARNIFGTHLEKVQVDRSYKSIPDVYSRKQLTITIDINLKQSYNPQFQELDNSRFNYELEQNGLLSYPYHITIHQQ